MLKDNWIVKVLNHLQRYETYVAAALNMLDTLQIGEICMVFSIVTIESKLVVISYADAQVLGIHAM